MTLRAHPERVVARIEMAWDEGDLSSVAELIHPAATLVPREGGPFMSGRELFLRMFRRTRDFEFGGPQPGGGFQAWGDTSVFHRAITAIVGPSGSRRTILAQEVWVLSRRDGLWSVVSHTTCDRPLVGRIGQ